jgi:hypothetical protein
VWFAPRWFGWGWAPVSPEGWVVAGAWLVATIVVAEKTSAPWWVTSLALPAVLLLVCWLKGTSPGSGRSRAAMERERRAHLVRGGGDPTPHLADIVQNWERLHEDPDAPPRHRLKPR